MQLFFPYFSYVLRLSLTRKGTAFFEKAKNNGREKKYNKKKG